MTRRLAVLAHFNALGGVAPHVLRQLDMLARSFDTVVVSSTSGFSAEARAAVGARAEIVERSNLGQDFGSWHEVLEAHDLAREYDEVLITNDSYVSAIDDLEPVIAQMTERPVEAWGLTKTWRHAEHIQSYFVFFTRPVLRSQAFERFWSDFRPARDRTAAIMQQEIGLSRALRSAGFRLGSYFEPTVDERRLANRRGVHWLIQRRRAFPARFHGFADHFRIRHALDPMESNNLNWATDFADFVFDRARYPVVKFDTLRYDPHWLGSERLLAACERYFPTQFAGVRDYMTATSSAYRGRPFENGGPVTLGPVLRRAIGYRPQGRREDRGTA
jgi:hypothetical protein